MIFTIRPEKGAQKVSSLVTKVIDEYLKAN